MYTAPPHSALYFRQIKRPYFHVKPLDKAQLKGWHAYLDWEMQESKGAHDAPPPPPPPAAPAPEAATEDGEAESKGEVEENQQPEQDTPKAAVEKVSNHKRVLVLFERCLIACALYEEFWLKVTSARGV